MMGLVELYSGPIRHRSVGPAAARAGFDTVTVPRRDRAASALRAFAQRVVRLRRRGQDRSRCRGDD